jgi:hypothetical protein
MRTRPGFARLLPLMTLTRLAAGTVAPVVTARLVQEPRIPSLAFRFPHLAPLQQQPRAAIGSMGRPGRPRS